MKIVGANVLEPLLRDCPSEENGQMVEMLGRITRLDVSFRELVLFLQNLAKKYGKENVQCSFH